MCEYAYYNKNKQLYCKLNDKMCLFSKYCMKQNKYIHREGADNCYMALEESKRKIPNDACYVRFVRKGFVYVEIGDKVIKKTEDKYTGGNSYYPYNCYKYSQQNQLNPVHQFHHKG